MQIQFGNPNIYTNHEVMREIKGILDSKWVSIGEYVEALEDNFKRKFGVRHAIACSSATAGLTIAIKAAGWQGQKIILPAFTWPSTLYALTCNNNFPVFCDIDRETWLPCHNDSPYNMIAVDVFGSQCLEYPNKVIYDAAHGYGLDGLGHRGIAEVVSLSFTKVVTAMEGGMILTNDDALAETATELRRLTARMGEINALFGLQSMKSYDRRLVISIINYYKKHITVPYRCQEVPTDTNNSVFAIIFDDTPTRDAVRLALYRAGCETKVYYDPLADSLPNTDYVYSRILALPIHEEVPKYQDDIIEIINSAARSGRTPGKKFLSASQGGNR